MLLEGPIQTFLYLLSKDFIRKGYNMTVTFQWSDVLEKLVWFWQKYVGPELINQSLKHRIEEQKTCEEEENANLPTKVVRESSSKTIVLVSKRVSSNVKVVKKKRFNSKGKAKPGKKAKLQMASVCLCGTCKMDVLDVPTNFEEESIKCDTCPIWYHFKCVTVSQVKRTLLSAHSARTIKL